MRLGAACHGAGDNPSGPSIYECLENAPQYAEVPLLSVDGLMAADGLEQLDMLLIDAEGNDMLVLRGAARALASSVRYVEFEVCDWADEGSEKQKQGQGRETLRETIDFLDGLGFDCWWGGYHMLWRITGCFDERYSNHGCETANVVCARRGDPWHAILDEYSTSHVRVSLPRGLAAAGGDKCGGAAGKGASVPCN